MFGFRVRGLGSKLADPNVRMAATVLEQFVHALKTLSGGLETHATAGAAVTATG